MPQECTTKKRKRPPKEDTNKAMREWRRKNPEKRLAQDRLYKKKYGMNFYARQDFRALHGKCAICGEADLAKLDIDHCHKTNKIRGVLCKVCNKAIGLFRDSPDLLSKAIRYLTYAGK